MTFLRFVTRFRSVGFFLVVVALCIASQLSMAQTQGRITGRVTDPSGAVIVGAKVHDRECGQEGAARTRNQWFGGLRSTWFGTRSLLGHSGGAEFQEGSTRPRSNRGRE